MTAAPVVVTTAAAVGCATVVVTTAVLRLRRLEAPAAQQAPVQTAMHMMTMHTMTQMKGRRTAMIIPTITPVDIVVTGRIKRVRIIVYN